ncbi:PadR family transcriptional regulator [Frigoribacterium sp. CFBP9030]|uniref:PadR family transcriptional regulator n=1 Tax=Frigoribacterium sp. CFBP9030 TaxID=3096537 RepID=UPI002A6B6F57|nr:PadR family transcriptional regulator [Frigoribacterium sp. CFBP9030]MDY0891551.1 PadR family transcriptional regulator [Frigoribacterium sp. CFBP9030]
MDNSRALLGLLSVEPTYGYDLKHDYDRHFGRRKPLALGQVYSTLARMIRDGLIQTLGAEAGGGPDRKRYEVTAAGREILREWMFTPDVPSDTLQSNLFAKTVIALLVGDDAEALLDAQRAEHMTRMREHTRAKRGADLVDVLLHDHALFHIEADLRWIELTGARLGELRQTVRPS